ncbi:hypothetical protein V2J09_008872 [Rumex salicifolius]
MSFAAYGFPLALKLDASLSLPLNKASVSGAPTSFEVPSMKLSSPAFKWRLLIAYDGTRYAGWQYQASPPTIQCFIENALTKITKLERKDLHLVGASRTDTGVHAWGQVAHFITPFNYDDMGEMHSALNGLLPSDIRVREVRPVLPDFHARFSTKCKIYHYKIFNGAVMDPFQRHYACHSAYKLNTCVMREAAMFFVGEHNFSSFANAIRNDRIRDPVKNIHRFDINEMVALLMQIGREAIPPCIVPKILACQDRRVLAKYALSAPPHGLSLMEVKYKGDHLGLPEDSPAISFGRRSTIRKYAIAGL